MPSWLYDAGPGGLWVFLLLTVMIGGVAAFVSGKSIAETWRPSWQIPVYMLLLGCAVRFLHFALFEEPFLSLRSFLVDFAVLLGIAVLGYRLARTKQMETQYGALGR